MKRQIKFQKGDIKEKKSMGWFKKFSENFVKPGYETAKFYKLQNKRILLTAKWFQTPGQLFEMFPNTMKYARKIKQVTSK